MTNKSAELIFVVEDDPAVAQLISHTLHKFAFRSQLYQTAGDFLRAVRGHSPHLCILDLGLPDMDGMQVIKQLRDKHQFGVLIVTGRDDTYDKVMGLELGADDYVLKPFEPRELIARVRSILRRYQNQLPTANSRVAEFCGWRFELDSNTLIRPDGHSDTLSVAEAQLLCALLERPNHILSREQLLNGRDVNATDRSIDLRVSRLRRRLEENPQHAKLIKTVYGAGYLFNAQVTWSL